MNEQFFKSIIDQDKMQIVVCNLEHTIVYMNPAADEAYKKHGGHALVGKSIFDCHTAPTNELIKDVVVWFAKSKENNLVHTFYNERLNKDVYMVALRNSDGELIGYYEKHEPRNRDESPFYVLD